MLYHLQKDFLKIIKKIKLTSSMPKKPATTPKCPFYNILINVVAKTRFWICLLHKAKKPPGMKIHARTNQPLQKVTKIISDTG